ncbi:hypothetical protein BTO30_02705 [Domibacillus antri]|uniref:TNase-like domain-containing protein n=1 Tax=Domibacillus antri TaxID=1714264 RepID=A0A1Q8Q949_9BACI|nr:thermonuclease family protein [Domibacillus antri]OLN23869.1 hypothetical protein BTO30_02705 [Domibacillus antri]
MQFLIGCLGLIIIIALIIAIVQWIFGNILAVIGVLIVIWGAYEWNKNRNMSVSSKAPAILIILGLFLTIGWFAMKPEPSPEVAEEDTYEEFLDSKQNEEAEIVPVTSDPNESDEETDTAFIKAKVLSVTDGDTIKVDLNGKEETVRLILVDTPETKHPQLGKQPLGEEASAFTTEQLNGKEVEIEPGIEERDRYGRLLAYVYVGDKMFNKTLIEEGLARVTVYPPNTEYLEELEVAQAAAKEKGIGIWEVENYATDDGYDSAVYEPDPEPEPVAVEPEPEPVVEEPAPAATVESFKNCTALRAVYPDGVPAGHPAYDSKHDRDGDDYACEN